MSDDNDDDHHDNDYKAYCYYRHSCYEQQFHFLLHAKNDDTQMIKRIYRYINKCISENSTRS